MLHGRPHHPQKNRLIRPLGRTVVEAFATGKLGVAIGCAGAMIRSFLTTVTSVMPWFASSPVLQAHPPSKWSVCFQVMGPAWSSTVAAAVSCSSSAVRWRSWMP